MNRNEAIEKFSSFKKNSADAELLNLKNKLKFEIQKNTNLKNEMVFFFLIIFLSSIFCFVFFVLFFYFIFIFN
jgi:hypothetical protein